MDGSYPCVGACSGTPEPPLAQVDLAEREQPEPSPPHGSPLPLPRVFEWPTRLPPERRALLRPGPVEAEVQMVAMRRRVVDAPGLATAVVTGRVLPHALAAPPRAAVPDDLLDPHARRER